MSSPQQRDTWGPLPVIRSPSCPPGMVYRVAPDGPLAAYLAVETLVIYWRWI